MTKRPQHFCCSPRAKVEGHSPAASAYPVDQFIRHISQQFKSRRSSAFNTCVSATPLGGNLAAALSPMAQPSFFFKSINLAHLIASEFRSVSQTERNGGWFACLKIDRTNGQRIFT